ncbi:MAG: double-strand break repair protein AddB [Devosia sp.]
MRLYSVEPYDPFLPTLAGRLLDGTLWPGGMPDDPFALADATIYLPTRRAARALGDAFLNASGRGVSVLPRIEALGDDESEAGETPHKGTIDPLQARVALAALIGALGENVARDLQEEAEGAQLFKPSSSADAIRLADSLMALMDQVETQEADWADLPGLVERTDLTAYWEITTRFLTIATTAWPHYLDDNGLITEAAARRHSADAAAARVPFATGPLIVAGSTGSIPATRRLIASIAQSDHGAVVLPGFDRHADPATWEALQEAPDGPSHPQYGMMQLLSALGAGPSDVAPLTPQDASATRPESAERRALAFRAALRPAATTDRWLADRQAVGNIEDALSGITLLEAADERQEAAGIAVAMRESMALGERVALVTPHRALARRVAHALGRWNIAVDDSAGEPLAATPSGVLARLVASVALSGGAAEWLGLLKHPLATFGLDEAVRRDAIPLIEDLFRGPRMAPEATLSQLKRIDGAAEPLVSAAAEALGPLTNLSRTADTPTLANAHKAAVLAVAPAPSEGEPTRDRAMMDTVFDGLAACHPLPMARRDWPGAFDALIGGLVVRGPPDEAAVSILGPLEARLQAVDHAILGGLNEGVWPVAPDGGPWMSRAMMHAFGIDLPERRIGLSAHDFVAAAHQNRVTLTRAKRAMGEPTVASRWWLRLAAFAGEGAEPAGARGRRLISLADSLETAHTVPPPQRPAPTPPVAARPTTLSITDVGRLVRDPYAVYARRVLRLKPLNDLGESPGARDRGEVIHEVLARFIAERGSEEDPLARFSRLVEEAVRPLAYAPEAQAVWSARLHAVAPHIIALEAERDGLVDASVVEVAANAAITRHVSLTGRIDRIDLTKDGADVIDYKTGTTPSANQVKTFLEPQLPLEAALVRSGAVEGVAATTPITGLYYVAVGAGRVPVRWSAVHGDDAQDLAVQSLARLVALLRRYEDPTFGYLSRARVKFSENLEGDYDHLARVAEWRHG